MSEHSFRTFDDAKTQNEKMEEKCAFREYYNFANCDKNSSTVLFCIFLEFVYPVF